MLYIGNTFHEAQCLNGLKVYPPRWPTIYKGEITYFDMG